LHLLPLLNSNRIELLDHPRLINQLTGLERRTSRAGRDTIDHVPGGHDDVANAAAGAAVLAAQALAHPEPPIVAPYVAWGRPWNWPGSATDTSAGAGIANTPPPKGYDRPSSAEPWFPYVDKW